MVGLRLSLFITMETQIKEEWRPVVGYEKTYEVSNFGEVRSKFSYYSRGGVFVKKLKLSKSNGYLRCGLRKHGVIKQYSVHRLVAQAFIPNPNNYSQVNHIDGVKHNNKVENLEWVSPKMNIHHAWATGLVPMSKTANNRKEKWKDYNIVITNTNNREKIIFDNKNQVCKFLGLSSPQIFDFFEKDIHCSIDFTVKYELSITKK